MDTTTVAQVGPLQQLWGKAMNFYGRAPQWSLGSPRPALMQTY